MKLFDRIMNRVANIDVNCGALALGCVMLIIVANVIYRMFGHIIPGTYELVGVVTVLGAAFALPYTEFKKQHTTVDMLTIHLRKRSRLRLEQFCNVIGLVYWLIIGYATLRITLGKAKVGEATDTLNISIVPFRAAWTLALFLMALMVLYNLYRTWAELRRKDP